MHHRYFLFLALLLLPLLNASSDRSAGCFVEYEDPRDTTFEGVVRFLTESYHDGVKVVIELKRILLDPLKTLGSLGSRFEAYLPGPICSSSVHIGKQQTWTGKYHVRGGKLALVVRIVRRSDTQNSDPCLQKRCHSGAICETWNDAARAKFAVCTCLAVHDLETIGLCQTTTGEVCASNGNIYASTCDMLRNACLQQTEFIIVSWTAVNQKDCQQQAELVKLRAVRYSPRDLQKVAVEMPKLPNEDEMHGEMPQQDGGYLTKQEASVVSTEPKDCTYTCSITAIEPVCGSDGNTYLNPCLLNLRACSSKQASNLHIAHWGYCPAKPPDIEPIFCDSANYCQLGAMCASGRNGLSYYNHDTFSWVTQQSEAQGTLCTCDHYRCSEKWYKEPICGDDGVTYPGDCFLNQAACIQQSPKYRLHSGPCKTSNQVLHLSSVRGEVCLTRRFFSNLGVNNPCQGYTCPFNAWCIPSDDFMFPRCVCHQTCYDVGDSDESAPVCGSNGLNYESVCHLKREACSLKVNISIKYWGSCDPCHTVNCPVDSICRLDERRNPTCRCGEEECNAPMNRTVCANDGRKYSNICVMRQQACLRNQKLRVLFDDNCAAGVNPCLEQSCPWPGEECRVDIQGRKSCVCPKRCPAIVVPVCGSDGITYDSICHLLRTACLTKKHIWVIHAGQCTVPGNVCERQGLYCRRYEICTQESSRRSYDTALTYVPPAPKCGCPICPLSGLGGKVCGSDGKTYRSECHLRVAACRGGLTELDVKQRGSCDACQNKQCDFYSICQTDEAGRAFCACPTNCLMVNMPVCGSDGKTYDNECLLKVHACSIQKNIRVIDTKPCASCSKPCPLGMRCLGGQCVCRESCPRPSLAGEVCGTDGRIYPSACELRRQACINKVTVKVDGSGLACRKLNFALNSSASIDVQADQVIDNGCGCNKIGSRDNYCDSKGRCRCHWGVEGVKCDQCASGYWGISNGKPCVSCSCNPYGSVAKTTCDNHSGQCKCKPGIRGQQCDICPNGELMVGEECEESIPKVHKQARISNVEVTREETMTRVSGIHFTPLATAIMPFNYSISPPFTFTVNFTPSVGSSDAHIALLVIPSAKKPNRYSFLRIGISSGHLELSYVDELETGKMRYLMAEQKLGHYALTLSAKVTNDEDLILRIANSSTFSVFEGASSRLIRSDEYGEMVTSRGMGLILGCVSQKRARGSTCGFSGCLTGVEVISYSHPGHDRRHILMSDGKAAGFSWKRPPVDNVGVCVSQIVSPLSPKTRSNTETIPTCGPLNPCKNGGQCISSADRTFKKCICSPGWQGVYCQTEATIIPEFDGKAYIRLAGPTGEDSLRKRKMSMELTFLRKPDDEITVISSYRNPVILNLNENRKHLLDACGDCVASSPPRPPSSRTQQSWSGLSNIRLHCTILQRAYTHYVKGDACLLDDGIIFAIPPSQTGSEFIVIRADTDGCLKVYLRVGRIAQFYRSYFYNWLRERFGPRQRLAIAKICSISNGVWHKLNVEKTNLYLTVRLDDKPAAGLRLLPQGLPRTNRDLRRALTTFDLSNSPVYLGGIPAAESRFIEEYVPSKRSFVGAIQKVVLNGAELVLAGPSHNMGSSQADLQLEHWEGTVQWQGPPCGEGYSTCTRNPDSVKRICRPLGNSYECSCSTPITHMSFVRRLTASIYGIDLLKNVTAQQLVSAKAEEMACDEIQARLGSAPKDFQHDVPNKDNDVVISFSQAEQKKTNALLSTVSQPYVGAAHHRSTVLFRGSTVINYRGFIKEEDIKDNIRIQLKTDALHGLVMMIPERSHQYEEFIAISLRNGRAEVHLSLRVSDNSSASDNDSVKLGEENTITLTAVPFLADGNWHTIQLIRHKEQIALIVDDQMVSGKMTGTDGVLNNEGSIWLGGALEPVTKPTWPYQRNFTGCISTIFFNEVLIDLLGSADILYGPIASCS